MKYSVSILFVLLLLISQNVSGQYYDTGQDPASLKWMQIKTGRFTVIYPEHYGANGLAYAKSLDEAYSKLVTIFPEKKFKIPVVIHSYSTMSNGYVAWAPKRMELYPTPEQNTIPLSTVTQLTVHELTHVFEMQSLNRGFTKAMSFVLGQQFTGIVAALLPQWFLEGDAVFAESLLTESGRGRVPSFQKQLKAISIDKQRLYKYDKILNGSYRDFIPDHYQYGYQIVTWAITKHDPEIWNKVLNYTANQPFTMNPVNISLLRNAGLTKKKLYKEAFDSLDVLWEKEIIRNNARHYETINPDKKNKFINYYSPVFAGKDNIIAVKTSLSVPAVFVLINPSEKTEKKIHTPGYMYPYFISCANGKVVWVETQSDMRWDNRDYSVIKILDLNSRRTKKLSHKTRYLAASISPDGRKIVAIENTPGNINNAVLIDAETGEIIQSVPAPGNAWLQHPQWSERGEKFTVISLTEEGEGIISYTPSNQKWETLVEAGREDLQSAYLKNDSLFYVSSRSGTDNIYIRTSGNQIKSVTSSRFGAIDISMKGKEILFSDYSSNGNSICITELTGAERTADENNASSSFLINRANAKPATDATGNDKVYTPEPYRKWKHLINFHSWMPFYADLEQIRSDPASVRPGISLITQNQLSTLISSIGYEYSAEKKHVLHSRVTWQGWYPVIDSKIDYGSNPGISKISAGIGDPSEIRSGLRFSNAISVPLRFSSGRFSEYLRPSLTSEYSNDYIYIKESGSYDYGQMILSGRLYFSNYDKTVLRDIYPKWAQTIDINYSDAPFDRQIYGSVRSMKSAFFFPGLFQNNSLKIRYEIEKQDLSKFMYSNRISFPRGYYNLRSTGFYILSSDYAFPLAYPDFNISSLLYVKRIRTSLFYDYATGPAKSFYKVTQTGLAQLYNTTGNKSFESFGFELMADFHILRIPFMISSGIQTAWKKLSEKPTFEFLLNIDLFGMNIGRERM